MRFASHKQSGKAQVEDTAMHVKTGRTKLCEQDCVDCSHGEIVIERR